MSKPDLKKMLSELGYYEHINDIKDSWIKNSKYINHFYFSNIDLTVVEDDEKLYFYDGFATDIGNPIRGGYKGEMSITDSNYMFRISLYNFNKQGILELKNFYKFERKYYPSEASGLANKIRLLSIINQGEPIDKILYQCINGTELINYNSTYISHFIEYSISLNPSFGGKYTLDIYFSEIGCSNIIMKLRIGEMSINKLNHLNKILNTYFLKGFDFLNSKKNIW